MLPPQLFLGVNRPYIVNKDRIDSFSNNDAFIDKYEIAISTFYRGCLPGNFDGRMNACPQKLKNKYKTGIQPKRPYPCFIYINR